MGAVYKEKPALAGFSSCTSCYGRDYLPGTTTTVLLSPDLPRSPSAPVDPVGPVYPVAPVLPVAPVAPASPVAPVAPAGPGTAITVAAGAAGAGVLTTVAFSHALNASAANTAVKSSEYLMKSLYVSSVSDTL